MTELNAVAADGGHEEMPVAVITGEGQDKLSIAEAARTVAYARKPKELQQQAAGEQRTDGAAQLAGGAGDATSQETGTRGETENADPGAQPPPLIEPPRSW